MAKPTRRNASLSQMLTEYRRTMLDGLQVRIRSGRSDRFVEVRDELEHSAVDAQSEIEIALLQMQADTLTRIDEALARLGRGTYGSCGDCNGEIAERRLRALPFAERCQACQASREEEANAAARVGLKSRAAWTGSPTVA